MNTADKNDIRFTSPRDRVEIHLPVGRVIGAPRGTPVGDYLKLLEESGAPPIVGAIINGELRELTFPIQIDSKVQPVTMGEADGMRIYRRSLTFLLEVAFSSLFPDGEVSVDHSVA